MGAFEMSGITVKKSRIGLKIVGFLFLLLFLFLIFIGTSFGKKEKFEQGKIFYKAPVTKEEVRRIGELVLSEGLFDGWNRKSFQLTKSAERYQIRIQMFQKKDEVPLYHKAIALRWGTSIANSGLKDLPYEIHLCNLFFKTNEVLTPDVLALMLFGKGELYYQTPITKEEAQQVGNFLSDISFFDKMINFVLLQKEGEKYLIQFILQKELHDVTLFHPGFKKKGERVAKEVLKTDNYEIRLSDPKLRKFKKLE